MKPEAKMPMDDPAKIMQASYQTLSKKYKTAEMIRRARRPEV